MSKYTPIMLLASERSGTNLLRAIMNSHSRIAAPPPCGVVDGLSRRAFHYTSPIDTQHVDNLINDAISITKTHMNPWDIQLDLDNIVNHMDTASFWQLFKSLNEIYAEENGCPYWFSKEPGLFKHIYEIKLNMPDARFIYMVRDGRDVGSSMLTAGLHANHIYDASLQWVNNQRFCLNALSDPLVTESMFLLRYEDLISSPELVVRNLMDFLDLDFQTSQMKYYQSKEILAHSQKSEFWTNISKPIDSTNKGKYKNKLNAKQIAIFESIAWDEMHALGYKVENHSKKEFSLFEKGIFRISAIVRKKIKQMDGKEETKRHQQRVMRMKEITNRSFNN